MTILVVFGDPIKFGVDHGKFELGDNGDCIYFAADRSYDNDKAILPSVVDETMLPVIQHKSGADNHNSQLNWLKLAGLYNPVNVENFSHDVDDLFGTIRRLFHPSTDQDANNRTQVSIFVKQYGNRAILKYLDNCAAWNALFLVSSEPSHEDEMNKYMKLVQPFVPDKLNRLPRNQWLPILEKAAVPFC